MYAIFICLLSTDTECRWVGAYFPFTHPSWELEVKMKNDWIEVLGCGIIRHEILQQGINAYHQPSLKLFLV